MSQALSGSPEPTPMDEFFDFEKLDADLRAGSGHDSVSCRKSEETGAPMEWQYAEALDEVSWMAAQSDVMSLDGVLADQAWGAEIVLPPQLDEGMESQGVGGLGEVPGWIAGQDAETSGHIAPMEDAYPRMEAASPMPTAMSSASKAQRRVLGRSGSTRTPASARRKGTSNRIPLEAKQMLEEEFAAHPYPCSWEIDIIAHQVNLDANKVKNWFNNARARKKTVDDKEPIYTKENDSNHSIASKLSTNSLKALNKDFDKGSAAPQPPLAVYLASSYLEEAAEYQDIQAAAEATPLDEKSRISFDSSTGSRYGRPASVITSQASSDGSAPTLYTTSSRSSLSRVSSGKRDRRRGRRRAAWQQSPYRRLSKIDGLDDAGLPSRNLPFFCTFCPRAFKTKYEWIRHEDSVHAMRTTWICCSNNNKHEPLPSCPFCGIENPDDDHMAEHKYFQCRDKPEGHRTFYRRDHFIQHLHHVHFGNVKHPSVYLGCSKRPSPSEELNYGCRHLSLRWRHFGAPMREDDPMLHCGFCGKHLSDWSERVEHVAQHLLAGNMDRSMWWPERKENHLENLTYAASPMPSRCRYCSTIFSSLAARNQHPACRIWSCRFLRTFDDVTSENCGPPLVAQFPSPKANNCWVCGRGYRSGNKEHGECYHGYRSCTQEFFTSEDEFLKHLHEGHAASEPVLLKGKSWVEEIFSRNKGASFEHVQLDDVQMPGHDLFELNAQHQLRDHEPSDIQSANTISPSRPPSKAAPRSRPEARLPRKGQALEAEHTGPRFFRFDFDSPSLASRIYYFHSAKDVKLSELFTLHSSRARSKSSQKEDELESREGCSKSEIQKGSIASLVMSSGLLGLGAVRLGVEVRKEGGGWRMEM